MNDTHLPDCSPPRRDASTTRASAHPELMNGDFAMRPRIHVPLSAEDRAAISCWSRRMLAACTLVIVGLAAHAGLMRHYESDAQVASAKEQTLSPTCLQWHQAASLVVARLVESTRDSDLRQVNDAVFRLRRARRNCEEGWFTLACQDYHAVARNIPGRVSMHDESLFACQRSANTGGTTTSR